MAQYEHNSERFGSLNLNDLADVQRALSLLGFDAGESDGKNGPNTQRAVRDFQATAAIKVDGIVGPETRQALVEQLDVQSQAGESEVMS
jgi:zinc D-Ala-D-Ala carboxypeptidase